MYQQTRSRSFVWLKLLGIATLATMAIGFGSFLPRGQHASAAGNSVTIVDFAFSPSTMTITAGETVTWTNTGKQPHTVTSDAGLFDSGPLQSGQSFSHTFPSAGSFAYHCAIHPFMTATIIVQPSAAAPAVAAAPSAATHPAAAQAATVASTAPQAAATVAAPRMPSGAATAVQPAPQFPNTGTGGLLNRSQLNHSQGGESVWLPVLEAAVASLVMLISGVWLSRRSFAKQSTRS